MIRNETNVFHLESYSYINRKRAFETLRFGSVKSFAYSRLGKLWHLNADRTELES